MVNAKLDIYRCSMVRLAFLAVIVFWVTLVQAEKWGPYNATYIRNYDGDTITLDIDLYPGLTKRVNVRLAEIDTPEIGGCDPELAIAAKQFTRAFLSQGFQVIITGKGKFGRPLVYMAVEGRDLGSALVAEGLARSYDEGWC